MTELLRLRRELGLTQAKMAEAMQIDRRTYQRMEEHSRHIYVLAARWVHHEAMAGRA